ncbi:MAG: hypothetical protein AB7C90_00515 [Bacteroidales bacterium]
MIDMMDVIYLTLFIVFVTFLIGFVVAWFISLIVPITDVAAFFDEHQLSLKRLKRIEKARQKGRKAKVKGVSELEDYYYEAHPDALSEDLRDEENRLQENRLEESKGKQFSFFRESAGKKKSTGKKRVDAVKEKREENSL